MVSYPSDWEETKLSDIGDTYSGLTGKTKLDFESGNGKFITFLNVLNNVKIDISILGKVHIGYNEKQNAVKVGDLFFNTSSETPEEVGMCAALLDNPGVCYLNSFCFGYRLKCDDVSLLFMSYYFNSPVGREFMRKHAQGSTRYNLSKQNFLAQSIPLPPLREQHAIADTLSTFDTHIKNLSELIEKKKAIRDGVLDDLMTGRTRLKGFCGEWKVKKLGDIVDIIRGASPRPIEKFITSNSNGINWIKISDVTKNKKYIIHTEEKITAIGASRSIFVKAGDLILSNSMSFGRPYILTISGCIHDGWLKLFNFDKFVDKVFLCYSLSSQNTYKQYVTFAAGSGVQNLNKNVVKNVIISLPPLAEQQAIADTLTALDNEISNLEAEHDKIIQVRDGAMNDLLTGKVRLI